MSDPANPYDSPHAKATDEPPSRKSWRWKFWLPFLSGITLFLLLSFLLPAAHRGRPLSLRAYRQLDEIGRALASYEATHGTLPPAVVTDTAGRPLYSWRVLLLPHLGHQPLYDRFALDEPWDSPHNRLLASEMPYALRSPLQSQPIQEGLTSYVALVDNEGRTVMQPTAGRTTSDLAEEDSGKIVVVDDEHGPVIWTRPVDLTPQAFLAQPDLEDNALGWTLTLRADGEIGLLENEARKSLVKHIFLTDTSTSQP